jgi:hypothetical protein
MEDAHPVRARKPGAGQPIAQVFDLPELAARAGRCACSTLNGR